MVMSPWNQNYLLLPKICMKEIFTTLHVSMRWLIVQCADNSKLRTIQDERFFLSKKYEYGYWMKISMKEILLLCTFHSAGRAPCWQLGENLQIFDRDNKTWKCCISFKIISNWTLFTCKKMIEKDIILCTIMNIWIQSSNIWSQLLPFICKPIKRFAQILACSETWNCLNAKEHINDTNWKIFQCNCFLHVLSLFSGEKSIWFF